MPEIHNPFFFWRGYRFEAVVGKQSKYHHSFGAVGGFKVLGQPPGKRGLHQILTLDLRDPALAALGAVLQGISRLPIFYGFYYESGTVEYVLTKDGVISISELDKTTYDIHWPYDDYPASFPVQPITLTSPVPCDLATFAREVWQGIKPRFSDHFIAIIPPSDAYGVNLWHPENNCDFIHVKSFFDPISRQTVVYNECD
jgi:hypothetical protein